MPGAMMGNPALLQQMMMQGQQMNYAQLMAQSHPSLGNIMPDAQQVAQQIFARVSHLCPLHSLCLFNGLAFSCRIQTCPWGSSREESRSIFRTACSSNVKNRWWVLVVLLVAMAAADYWFSSCSRSSEFGQRSCVMPNWSRSIASRLTSTAKWCRASWPPLEPLLHTSPTPPHLPISIPQPTPPSHDLSQKLAGLEHVACVPNCAWVHFNSMNWIPTSGSLNPVRLLPLWAEIVLDTSLGCQVPLGWFSLRFPANHCFTSLQTEISLSLSHFASQLSTVQ